jgi:hypothetical protein
MPADRCRRALWYLTRDGTSRISEIDAWRPVSGHADGIPRRADWAGFEAETATAARSQAPARELEFRTLTKVHSYQGTQHNYGARRMTPERALVGRASCWAAPVVLFLAAYVPQLDLTRGSSCTCK